MGKAHKNPCAQIVGLDNVGSFKQTIATAMANVLGTFTMILRKKGSGFFF